MAFQHQWVATFAVELGRLKHGECNVVAAGRLQVDAVYSTTFAGLFTAGAASGGREITGGSLEIWVIGIHQHHHGLLNFFVGVRGVVGACNPRRGVVAATGCKAQGGAQKGDKQQFAERYYGHECLLPSPPRVTWALWICVCIHLLPGDDRI